MVIQFNFIENEEEVAVALSGGGDSLALAHMVCVWAAENNRHVHLLHVNHQLRAEADKEAEQLAKTIQDFPNCEFHVLKWENDNPKTAIMEQARNARYDLMHDYCELKNIKTLCVGHHADDQLETFLFRLAKGSGLDGLTGMREWTDFKTLKLYRPLLQLTHSELIHYCNNNGLKYFDDPLNEDNKYARPRLRQALRKEGLDTKRFIKTLDRLARGRDALDEMAETIFELLYMKRDNINTLDYQSLKKYPLDIQIRVLQKAISYVGYSNGYYPPKLERIEEIIATLCPNKSATLYGCLISLSKDGYTLEIKHA